jgi:hypothetical protein
VRRSAAITRASRSNAGALARSMVESMRPRRVRTMEAFAAEEIVLPSGPMRDTRWRWSNHPAGRAIYRELDRAGGPAGGGRYRGLVLPKPTQDGGSAIGSIIPAMFHLFELRESVALAAPDGATLNEKWAEDFRPMIEASRYRSLLPRTGPGSRGGEIGGGDRIELGNGTVIKTVAGQARESKRAGFTYRVVIVTECDIYGGSTVAERLRRINKTLARVMAYGDASFVYLECTPSGPDDVIWRFYGANTASRVAVPCPHCGALNTWDRDDLVGWREAAAKGVARSGAAVVCRGRAEHWIDEHGAFRREIVQPGCGAALTDEERRAALEGAVLVHADARRMAPASLLDELGGAPGEGDAGDPGVPGVPGDPQVPGDAGDPGEGLGRDDDGDARLRALLGHEMLSVRWTSLESVLKPMARVASMEWGRGVRGRRGGPTTRPSA